MNVIEYTHYSKILARCLKKSSKRKKKTYDLDFSLDINTDELDESEKNEIIKLYKELNMVINTKIVHMFIDNSDTTVFISGNPKKSYLFPY
ncbi:hypothetical protein GL982_09670 (plasmid) [Spiroplasma citri]|uniref:hypothetical protein n=1 Tax=Spiroplasma citri TaxID=2133 RepID=UPI0013A094EE|nr:hypothetical protein [Spiroplasma citri]QIA73826.1 hypothetical protein GL982_09670 [Spiroplasma citri]